MYHLSQSKMKNLLGDKMSRIIINLTLAKDVGNKKNCKGIEILLTIIRKKKKELCTKLRSLLKPNGIYGKHNVTLRNLI